MAKTTTVRLHRRVWKATSGLDRLEGRAFERWAADRIRPCRRRARVPKGRGGFDNLSVRGEPFGLRRDRSGGAESVDGPARLREFPVLAGAAGTWARNLAGEQQMLAIGRA